MTSLARTVGVALGLAALIYVGVHCIGTGLLLPKPVDPWSRSSWVAAGLLVVSGAAALAYRLSRDRTIELLWNDDEALIHEHDPKPNPAETPPVLSEESLDIQFELVGQPRDTPREHSRVRLGRTDMSRKARLYGAWTAYAAVVALAAAYMVPGALGFLASVWEEDPDPPTSHASQRNVGAPGPFWMCVALVTAVPGFFGVAAGLGANEERRKLHNAGLLSKQVDNWVRQRVVESLREQKPDLVPDPSWVLGVYKSGVIWLKGRQASETVQFRLADDGSVLFGDPFYFDDYPSTGPPDEPLGDGNREGSWGPHV